MRRHSDTRQGREDGTHPNVCCASWLQTADFAPFTSPAYCASRTAHRAPCPSVPAAPSSHLAPYTAHLAPPNMHCVPCTADRTPRTLGFANANVSRGGEAGCAECAGILLATTAPGVVKRLSMTIARRDEFWRSNAAWHGCLGPGTSKTKKSVDSQR